MRDVLRRPVVLIPAAILAAVAMGAAIWSWYSGRDVRDARRRVPALLALAERGEDHAFYRDARAVVPLLADDVLLQQRWTNMTAAIPIQSEPEGAEVMVKGYGAAENDWIAVGRTPLSQARVLLGGTTRVKMSKSGFAPFDGTLFDIPMNVTLDPLGTVPDGMVRVPERTTSIEGVSATIPTFWLDRLEVSHRQFKAFVDAGGYKTREYWKEPFVDKGRPVSWEDAMALFRDSTGRPGPSTWVVGTFPEDQADHPVSGVSWYEAAAYAIFAGKTLPTAFQWRTAAGFTGVSGVFGDILLHSNFGTKGPAPVGSSRGIGPFGAYDMAGNVKEWCWNETPAGG